MSVRIIYTQPNVRVLQVIAWWVYQLGGLSPPADINKIRVSETSSIYDYTELQQTSPNSYVVL